MKKLKRYTPKPEELEKFQFFIFEMDDALDRFREDAKRSGFELDGTLEGILKFEEFVLSKTDPDSQFVNRAARYLGEVFRKNIGGNWELCVKDPKYLYFMLPVISGYSDLDIEFCPIQVISSLIDQRKPGLLRRAIASHEEFKSTQKCKGKK